MSPVATGVLEHEIATLQLNWLRRKSVTLNSLSVTALNCLRAAGWKPGRRVDVRPYESAYADNGYSCSDAALEFLQEFGGLCLKYPHFRDSQSLDKCDFDAETAALGGPLWVSDYVNHLGRRLVPIGHAFSEVMLLLIDDYGAIYAAGEGMVGLAGNTSCDTINALCGGKQLVYTAVEDENMPDRHLSGSAIAEVDETVRRCLRKAGWKKGRKVDISVALNLYADYGLTCGSRCVEFLSEFCGITVKASNGDAIVFDPSDVVNSIASPAYERYSALLKEDRVCPIGTAGNGSIVLLMGSSGGIYGVLPETHDWIVRFGQNYDEALRSLVMNTGAKSISP